MPIDAMTFRPTPHGKVHRCATCAFEYIAPRPTPEETATFYDIGGYYTQGHDAQPDTGPPRWLSRARVHLAWRFDRSRLLVDVIAERLPAGASIVDIGCGDGKQLATLSQRGFRMTGVERDIRSLSLRSDAATVYEGSAEALPPALARGSFDAVTFKQVLEHLVDPVAAMRNAAALLKPGGVMFVEVPNNEAAVARQSGLSWEHMDVPRHLNFFDLSSLQATAQHAGLKYESAFFNEYCRCFADAHLAIDQRIFDQLGGAQPAKRHTPARSWGLLLRTLTASPRQKYDNVGIVAVKPG